MAATPKNATFTFIGRSGQRYQLDAYISDVANAAVTFNVNGSAASTSPSFWICPEDVTLIDYSMITGTADTVGLTLTQNQAPRAATAMRYANFLNTIAYRPVLNRSFPGGSQFGANQFA